MTVMAGASISPALPQMKLYFQSWPHSGLLVKMLLSVHALFIALSAPLMGLMIDRFGRKAVLVMSIVLYGAAGSSGFFMDSLYTVIAGRAFLGIAVAGIMSGFTTLIGDYFKDEKLNRVMGLQAAFSGFGGLAFLSVGGMLADLGWRYPFLIYLYAFMVLPGVLIFVYEPHAGEDEAGGSDRPSGTAPSAPIKKLSLIYSLAFIGMLVFYLVPVQLPFYLKSFGNISNTRIGVAIGVMNLVGALSSMQFKKIRAALSHSQIYMLFAFLMGAGYLAVYTAENYITIIIGMVVAGAGFGLLMPNVNVWAVSLASPNNRGKIVGGLTTFFLLGQFVSPILFEPAVKRIGIGNCYGWVGGILAVSAVVAGLASLKRP